MTVRGRPGGDAADRALEPVLRRLLPSLGTHWVAVVEGAVPLLGAAHRPPRVLVAVGEAEADARHVAPHDRVTTHGALDALPVLSESATGVLVRVRDADAGARAAPEVARLLQPGGLAVFVATWPASAVTAFDGPVDDAGLHVVRRLAIRRAAASPGAWLAIERRRASAATGDTPVECAIVARRAGPDGPPLPTAAGMLADLFIPRIGRRR